jgi:hypothetical protein
MHLNAITVAVRSKVVFPNQLHIAEEMQVTDIRPSEFIRSAYHNCSTPQCTAGHYTIYLPCSMLLCCLFAEKYNIGEGERC